MNPRSFTNRAEAINRSWLSEVLGIPIPEYRGIDLLGNGVGVEFKSSCKRSPQYTVHYYQYKEFPARHPDAVLWWAFMSYGLTAPVKELDESDIKESILNRRVWFLEWDWVGQFPVVKKKSADYIYIHQKDIPGSENFEQEKVGGGTLYIPKRATLETLLDI